MKKRLISNRVLQTELSMAMQYIDRHDFGYAKECIEDVLDRVKEYDSKRIDCDRCHAGEMNKHIMND